MDGRPLGSIWGRAGSGGTLEGRFGALGRRIRRGRGKPCPRHADDVRFDHHVVRAADEQEMLHVVPAQENELPLAVEIVDVDDAEPRLARAAPVLSGQHQPPAGQPPEHEPEKGDEDEDDDEGDDVLGGLRRFNAKSGQHDGLSRCAGRGEPQPLRLYHMLP